MFCKLIVVAACVVAAIAQADRWPAGLNPALCPNYPNCDNALIALHRNTPYIAPVAPVARQWPAGVSPAACPNYPYCNTGGLPLPVAYFAAPAARQWPAGVNPASCPNYPYC